MAAAAGIGQASNLDDAVVVATIGIVSLDQLVCVSSAVFVVVVAVDVVNMKRVAICTFHFDPSAFDCEQIDDEDDDDDAVTLHRQVMLLVAE